MATCEAIKTTTLEIPTTAIDWTGISNTYKWLEIIGYMRSDKDGVYDTFELNLNGDTGNNYSYKFVEAIDTGSSGAWSIGKWGLTDKLEYEIPAKRWGYQSGSVHILIGQNPSSEAHKKSIMATTGFAYADSTSWGKSYCIFGNGFWQTTSDITQITMTCPDSFVEGPQVTLLGWKDS